jgi:GT2 family glycosyltransferase
MEKISFCIASAKNEKEYTLGVLKSLKDNTDFSNHEVLIFIDSDNQNTYKSLLEYKNQNPNVKIYQNLSKFPIGSQRNVSIMFHHAINDVVIYLQSDMVVCPNFDKYFLEALNKNKNRVISAARIEPPIHPASPEKIVKDFGLSPEDFKYDEFYKFTKNLQKENRPLMTGHFAPFGLYKETYFNIMGGFDTRFRCSREDSDFIIRLNDNKLESLQTWNASVYHYTCVSSRGTEWYKKGPTAEIKNQWQTKADQEELKRFIRKWGYFGHDYKPKYNSTLVLDINTSPNITTLAQIEPYFNKIVLNDEVLLNQLVSFIEFESTYYSNKRWNYTKQHWDKVKSTFIIDNIKDKIILEKNFKHKDDIIIKTDLYSLHKADAESSNFIQHSNQIFNNLLKESPNEYKGSYDIGCFNIKINNLEDINKKHLDSKQYQLLLDIDKFKFI